MKFVLNINCDNEDFAEDADETVANLLLDIANIVREGMERNPEKIRDSNGNIVGFFEFVTDTVS